MNLSMRFTYALALVLTITVGVTYWYESTKHICPTPVSYRLGTIDDSFSITQAEAYEAMERAITLWEDSTGRDLFVYDEQADLTVSFIFDDRQALADAQLSDQERLDQVAVKNEGIRASIQELQTTYEGMQSAFAARKAAYDQELATYNDEVRQANDRGGASADAFKMLEETQQTLQTESQNLQVLASNLSSVASQLNDLSAEGNRLVRTYNQDVIEYNRQYSGGEEFTQGDFTGEAIHIYKFSNQNELVSVLAHEFGHALGIGHVEGDGSLMYYLLAEGGEDISDLSPADLEAYQTVCQTEVWDFKLRSIIRSIIS